MSPFGSEDALPGSRAWGRVRALLGRVRRAGLPDAFWCAAPLPSPLSVLAMIHWPPPGWGCPVSVCLFRPVVLCLFFSAAVVLGFCAVFCLASPRLRRCCFLFLSSFSFSAPWRFFSVFSFSVLWFCAPASCPPPSPPPALLFFLCFFSASSCFFAPALYCFNLFFFGFFRGGGCCPAPVPCLPALRCCVTCCSFSWRVYSLVVVRLVVLVLLLPPPRLSPSCYAVFFIPAAPFVFSLCAFLFLVVS